MLSTRVCDPEKFDSFRSLQHVLYGNQFAISNGDGIELMHVELEVAIVIDWSRQMNFVSRKNSKEIGKMADNETYSKNKSRSSRPLTLEALVVLSKTNLRLVAGVFSIMVSSSVFAADPPARIQNPLVQKVDLRVAGPGGQVLVYYRDGNDIVIRNCGNDYSAINQRSDCKAVGAENRVPVSVFKQVLKSQFLVGNADKLKPMTAAELTASRSGDANQIGTLKASEAALDAKLVRIKAFIKENGSDATSAADQAATEKLLADARTQLSTAQSGSAAIDKVNKLINDIVEKKISGKDPSGNDVWEKVSAGNNGSDATFNLLSQFDASKGECGTDEILNDPMLHNPGVVPGRSVTWLQSLLIQPAMAAGYSVDDRIKNCISLPGAVKTSKSGVRWNLVSRKRDPKTGKFYEVWKDSKSGLLWGDLLEKQYKHTDAVNLDSSGNVTSAAGEVACGSDGGKIANAGIQEKKFGLPTKDEFEQAEKNGLIDVAPNMAGNWFWSTSLVGPRGSAIAYAISGKYGFLLSGIRALPSSVRCVGR